MGKNITKRDLINDIADRNGMTRESVRPVVELLLESIKGHLSAGHTIELRGFGTFSRKRRDARPARNPRTGEPVALAERYVPVLRFTDAFRERVATAVDRPEE